MDKFVPAKAAAEKIIFAVLSEFKGFILFN
jgi:hypothetical protein